MPSGAARAGRGRCHRGDAAVGPGGHGDRVVPVPRARRHPRPDAVAADGAAHRAGHRAAEVLHHAGRAGHFAGLAFAHVVLVVPYVLRLVIAAATGFDRAIAQAAESLGASRLDGVPPDRAAADDARRRRRLADRLHQQLRRADDVGVRRFAVHGDAAGEDVQPHRPHHRSAVGVDLHRADRADAGPDARLDRLYGLDRILAGKT